MSLLDSINSFGFEFTNYVQVVIVFLWFVIFLEIIVLMIMAAFAAFNLGYGVPYLVVMTSLILLCLWCVD